MDKIFEYLGNVIDLRQESKVLNKMSDIVVIVFLD